MHKAGSLQAKKSLWTRGSSKDGLTSDITVDFWTLDPSCLEIETKRAKREKHVAGAIEGLTWVTDRKLRVRDVTLFLV